MSHAENIRNITPVQEAGDESVAASETSTDLVQCPAGACQLVIADAMARKITGSVVLEGLQKAGAMAIEAKDYIKQFKEHLLQEKSRAERLLLWNSHLTTIFYFVLVCYCLALWMIL